MMYLAACKTAVDIYKCDHYIVADITVAINDPKKSKYLSCRNILLTLMESARNHCSISLLSNKNLAL